MWTKVSALDVIGSHTCSRRALDGHNRDYGTDESNRLDKHTAMVHWRIHTMVPSQTVQVESLPNVCDEIMMVRDALNFA